MATCNCTANYAWLIPKIYTLLEVLTYFLKKMMYPNSVACETVIQRSMGTADRLLYCNELFGMLCEDKETITNFRADKEVESLCSL